MRPCIIIPGIQGSVLQNTYPISPATTWSTITVIWDKFTAPDFNVLALDDTAVADRGESVITRPSQLLEIAYAPLVQALQGRLGVPAYLFPYDWRYSIVQSAQDLVQFLKRLKQKQIGSIPEWDGRFDFAVHSLGGLVLRALFTEWSKLVNGEPAPVGQVVFIATPHRGSVDAAVALISGETPWFGGRKEMRKLARTFPSVYELLPTFQGAITRAGKDIDIFQESNWQKNVVDPDPARSGFDVQQDHLTKAKVVRDSLRLPSEFGVRPDDQLVIFGNKPGAVPIRVDVGPAPDNWYDFDNASKGPGDDVVPVVSARLDGIAAVELTPDDVSYFFHPIQREMTSLDMHAFLPALDEVATIVARFFSGGRGAALLPIGLPPSRFHPA
jgi:Lecithin:cholesterol acyltransferase